MDNNGEKPRRALGWLIPSTASEDEDSWQMVYMDVITLLLVMFVIMLALAGGPSDNPGPLDTNGGLSTQSPEAKQSAEVASNSVNDLGEGVGDLGGSIDVIQRENGVSFRISNDVLFASGKSELSNKGFDALSKLVPFLARTDYRITVAGHTDNIPIATDRFPSNWELSSARAGSVVRYFQYNGIEPARMIATGHADTVPLAANDSLRGRATNRRVELILEDASRSND